MARRPCLDCGTPTDGNRCPAHRTPDTRAMRNSRAWKTQARQLYGQPCHWCGQPADTGDHLIALAKGGTHDPSNVVPACRSCNSKRGALN